jgi:hypothetical protein
MSVRIAKLEGSYDALKVVRPMTVTVLGILMAALIFVLSFMAAEIRDIGAKLDATSAKVDAIPAKLAEEFRAMRGGMAAQTSALANSITAARQFQPQIILATAGLASRGAEGGPPSSWPGSRDMTAESKE